MKIAYMSDCHIEFGPLEIKNDHGADVLVIAGDVLIAEYLNKSEETILDKNWKYFHIVNNSKTFLKNISDEFKDVIIIAGNHEYYRGCWNKTLKILEHEYGKYKNIHFLENNSKCIDGVLFVGSTLWTDCNKNDPVTIQQLKYRMNDYSLIKNELKGYIPVTPVDTMMRFRTSFDCIFNMIKNTNKCVIVTHHSPSFNSVHPKYRSDRSMNGGYCSNLSDFILDNPQIKYWIHGHVHDEFDYMIGDTRILCNPRGYIGHQECANEFKLKVVEI